MLLYIFWFLHQTTTSAFACTSFTTLYIFWFLHQTTTTTKNSLISCGCISFDSYIKPQLSFLVAILKLVVYLLIPTSNHNSLVFHPLPDELYIFWFLHQTTTRQSILFFFLPLYIFWFLHQTTTPTFRCYLIICCISFDSYIKPQLRFLYKVYNGVVYLLIPTSNHNYLVLCTKLMPVVYLLIPTSNHNVSGWLIR